jgi:signal transduction histidine kinase
MAANNKLLEGYRVLIEIAQDLGSTLELDHLLNRILLAGVKITSSEAASILLYDDSRQELFFQASTNLESPIMHGLVVPLEKSIAGWIVLNRNPVRITDVQKDPRHFEDIQKITRYPTQSMIGVPLITKEKVVGVLEVINKKSGEFDDIDEQLMIENARLFQQSDLIAEFVHELRTPLASIAAASYLINKPNLPADQRDQLVQNITSESTRLNDLATDFLNLARLESGRVQFTSIPFDLSVLLEECETLMQPRANENQIKLTLNIPTGIPLMVADRDKIKQVFINLISNAIKYNFPGGWVKLTVEQKDDEILLQVSDNGIGIPEYALHHLFEKFYRVKSSEEKAAGTGLGLSICLNIIQNHGGHIDVVSTLGSGSQFRVFLPWPAENHP